MSNVLVEEASLQAIADTIRSKLGVQDTYKPSEMADAIDEIGGGATGTINITANGTYNVTDYASAYVAVPSANLGSKTIIANGTYDAEDDSLDGYDSVTVNVSGSTGESAWMDAPEPSDSKLHIWINVSEDVQKDVRLKFTGTGNVDWGDGTTESPASLDCPHVYSELGVYEIVVDWSGTRALPANNCIVVCSNSLAKFAARTLIRRVYIPDLITDFGQYKLQNCNALEKVTFKNIGIMGNLGVQNCRSLRNVDIAEGVTSIGDAAFQYCECILSVTIPSTVTSIGTRAFDGVRAYEFHFKPTTPPTLSNTNAFANTESASVFYVPYSADHSVLAAYQAASNWSTYASRMVEES